MEKILDLHIHSKYSMACSTKLEFEYIDEACREKGVDIIASGDFTHPAWFSGIKKELEEVGSSGLYKLRKRDDDKVKFILATELALIYKDGGMARRLHIMVQAPNLEAAEKLNNYLNKCGFNLASDGRPILGLPADELVRICLDIHPEFLIYPAHIWTPWFAVFGSKSGYNSMEECFKDQTENIYAYETGLSSDPEMNWRLSALDNLTTLSSSDAHSPANIAREANVMDLEKETYSEIYEIIKNKDLNKFKKTIEFYPEEGMYHYDGHRNCGIVWEPGKTRKNKNICPACKKPLTVGVMHRVEELADREEGFVPQNHIPYMKLVGLEKIIADSLNIKSRNSKAVQSHYRSLLANAGSELFVLMHADIEKIKNASTKKIAEGVRRVREQDLQINPGFDGQYGEIKIFNKEEVDPQSRLL